MQTFKLQDKCWMCACTITSKAEIFYCIIVISIFGQYLFFFMFIFLNKCEKFAFVHVIRMIKKKVYFKWLLSVGIKLLVHSPIALYGEFSNVMLLKLFFLYNHDKGFTSKLYLIPTCAELIILNLSFSCTSKRSGSWNFDF